ncbi:MAG: DUF2298 domain-containing protein [Candidatus Roizmanbacteria bacterium]
MTWIYQTLQWYVALFLIGIIFFPLTSILFSRFIDRGYAFSKVIAIIIISYLTFIGGILHIIPFSQVNLYLICISSLIFNIYIFKTYIYKKNQGTNSLKSKKHKQEIITSTLTLDTNQKIIIIIEELLFLGGLFFLTYIRGQEPSLRGLEKFMDFGFMNSILRSQYFPPLDMWLSGNQTQPAGFSINYYYFGHLTGAVLIKLVGINPAVGYNLVLATILGLGLSQAFSICTSLTHVVQKIVLPKINLIALIFVGLLGSFLLNFGGNLHAIYVFTKGYTTDNPTPFWTIMNGFSISAFKLYRDDFVQAVGAFVGFAPEKYWYPNATRFIPFTIHEFPSYSYVVADLHGHVFGIPFVLLTIATILHFYLKFKNPEPHEKMDHLSIISKVKKMSPYALLFGFLIAIHYMTNVLDVPIYLLLVFITFFLVFRQKLLALYTSIMVIITFILCSLPFSLFFIPFASGIGVNCPPAFLSNIKKLGPFLFIQENCQVSPPWMLFILWGFFWICCLLFIILLWVDNRRHSNHKIETQSILLSLDTFILLLFGFGTFLIIIPEFFYAKDIYPAHFRANTMFKLGYQAFIIMSLASTYVFYRIASLNKAIKWLLKGIFVVFFFFVAIYPFFAIPSYYGTLKKEPQLDGTVWLNTIYPEDKEIIDYINTQIVKSQPTILEAQGDSYTDYDRVSAYTGLPTVAGWWVHEWLWRNDPDVVGKRIPDVVNMYESNDLVLTIQLLKKYNVKYIVVSTLERNKYTNIKEDKFGKIGKKIFQSKNKKGLLYQVN